MIRFYFTSVFFFLTALLFFSCTISKPEKADSEILLHPDSVLSLENKSTRLKISLLGGDFIEFSGKAGNHSNVFSWSQIKDPLHNSNSIRLKGQFISIGRWGNPSPGEAKAGMPPNGEAANNWWVKEFADETEADMSCDAPLDGVHIKRQVQLADSAPLFKVSEIIYNDQPTGKNFTVVQNLFFSAPFLTDDMILQSNAAEGFNQAWAAPDPGKFEYKWPNAFVDTLEISTLNLQKSNPMISYTSSHIFQDSIAWVTAFNPTLHMLLGYVWRTRDYPWFHIRNIVSYKSTLLRGIAFGTTGMSDRYTLSQQIITTFHGIKNFEFLDAKASLTKNWYCLLLTVPENYKNTRSIILKNDIVSLKINTSQGIREYHLGLKSE